MIDGSVSTLSSPFLTDLGVSAKVTFTASADLGTTTKLSVTASLGLGATTKLSVTASLDLDALDLGACNFCTT